MGHAACMGEMRKDYIFLIGTPDQMTLLWRTRCQSEDNFKMDTQSLGFHDARTKFIHIRIQHVRDNLSVLKGAGNKKDSSPLT